MKCSLLMKTAYLSASHFVVRVLGFALRLWMSRALGAQAMGLVELSQSAQSLLVTPVVSGLPAAVSRMSARSSPARQVRVLRCALGLSLLVSLPVAALGFAFRVPLALWLGEIRTLPALLAILPCIPVLGLACALNGYCYGTGRTVPPALSELLEQVLRIAFTVQLIHLLTGFPMMLRAAVPAVATLLAEALSLMAIALVLARSIFFSRGEGSRRAILGEMVSLALPLTGMRLVSSLMRTVQSALIPARLQASGLPASEALAQLGMMNGMLMPILLLPSFITCSLSMVASPELARRQAAGKPLRPLARSILRGTLAMGLLAMAAVWLAAPLFAALYRQAELLALIRSCCPLVPLMALCQVTGGLMNGLGLQGQSLRISLVAGFASLLVMYVLTALPPIRIWGAALAIAAAQAITLGCSLRTLGHALD